ncbi:MAG: hypothetical protein GY765_22000 [bacterium]|nr:hypothetical protein [bacterium]
MNYFIGKNKSKWFCDVPTSQAVLYKSLYRNIDLKVYGLEKQIEYDWLVKPMGDPGNIQFQYKNVKGTRLDTEGNLIIETDFGELMHKKPVSYQLAGPGYGPSANSHGGGQRIAVDVRFKRIAENTYGFEVGAYDVRRELIIDPVVLAYSTYLGGTGRDSIKPVNTNAEGRSKILNGIAVDDAGNIYVTGYTSSTNFPTLNQYQADQGDSDVFLTKLDPTKRGAGCLLYSTYFGGGSDEFGRGMAVDAGGNAYVSGYTTSTDFPTLNAYQEDQTNWDAFVIKFDTTESGVASLLYSTYLGGGTARSPCSPFDFATGIAVGTAGIVYVTGGTYSTDYPTLNEYQGVRGTVNAFVTKLDTTRSGAACLLYSTYLGGVSTSAPSTISYGHAIAVDAAGLVYVAGETYVTDFPVRNQYQTYSGVGNADAFITKLDTTQTGAAGLLYSTYLGGVYNDYGYGIAVDGAGNAYVAGSTSSSDFPLLNHYQTDKGGLDVFVAKLDTTQSGAACLLYSTYLGGANHDFGYAIALDASGSAYVTGSTSSTNFPNTYRPHQGNYDAFVAGLDPTRGGASSLIYSTHLGGAGDDYGKGIAVDTNGNAYVTGYTDSTDFITLNHYQTFQGDADAFVSKVIYNSNYYFHGADYNGDLSADIAVFRRSIGRWFVMGSPGVSWGTQIDIPVPGDYDGDGDTDIAIFRPSTGRWCIMGQASTAWGTAVDVPVPGDYDGDGDTDIAIFRPSTGRWCIMGQASVAWGTVTDIPVPADYDGDGDTDIAIYRPSIGRWCILGQPSIACGTSTDIPVPADYDGDGDADIAVFRPSTGRWCVLGSPSVGWGTSIDIPVPADYDGDGDDDIAVFRPSTGRWCVMGQASIPWGTSSDTPLVSHKDR